MTDVFADLKVPGPTMIDLTEPFWEAVPAGRLMIQRCDVCSTAIFYPRAICPKCWSESLVWEDASGVGRLKSFSQVHKPGHPGWVPVAPYTVGLVELAEGPTMLSLILPNKRHTGIGDSLTYTPTNIGGRIMPAFQIIS